MPYKIKSTAFLEQRPDAPHSAEDVRIHEILSAERQLKPGNVVKIQGHVAMDVEGRQTKLVGGVLKIIDDDTISVRYQDPHSVLGEIISRGESVLGYFEGDKWRPERIVKKGESLEDVYNGEPIIPELFGARDRWFINRRTAKMVNSLEGTKYVYSITELVYHEDA